MSSQMVLDLGMVNYHRVQRSPYMAEVSRVVACRVSLQVSDVFFFLF
jgi:hypothetical protein